MLIHLPVEASNGVPWHVGTHPTGRLVTSIVLHQSSRTLEITSTIRTVVRSGTPFLLLICTILIVYQCAGASIRQSLLLLLVRHLKTLSLSALGATIVTGILFARVLLLLGILNLLSACLASRLG
jgi:hypothetical protein